MKQNNTMLQIIQCFPWAGYGNKIHDLKNVLNATRKEFCTNHINSLQNRGANKVFLRGLFWIKRFH